MNRIAILLPDLRGGGAERVNVNLANAFATSNVSVDMLLMRDDGELRRDLDPRVRLVILGASRPRSLLGPLKAYLRSERPTALLANMWPLTVIAVLARKLSGSKARLVVVEHNTWSVAPLSKRYRTRLMIRTTMHLLLPGADHIVAVSNGVAKDLERFAWLGDGTVTTIYNPVVRKETTVADSYPVLSTSWASGSHKRVLAVGSLKEQKDFGTLIKAFDLLRRRVDARLLILGEGQQRGDLEALVRQCGLEGLVEMPGFTNEPTSFYRSADLFVLSSVNEGLPTVLIEALAQGTPVVSTDCPSGPREILAGGIYGQLVPVDDPGTLSEAMFESLRSPHDPGKLRFRAQTFSVERVANQYLELLLPENSKLQRSA